VSAARTVWVVEDSEVLRESLRLVLDAEPGLACPLAVESCEEALAALAEDPPPDLVLMDIGLPGIDGIEGTRRIRSLSPATAVVILTVHDDDERVFAAICAGASGYLLKPTAPERIAELVRLVERGGAPINPFIARRMLEVFQRRLPAAPAPEEGYGLSPREREVLELLVDGLTMRQIAEREQLSYHTVDKHLRNVYAKLHVRSRSKAVAKAVREKLV
jgi:DNA-binding NarL/FixJ family response regulator